MSSRPKSRRASRGRRQQRRSQRARLIMLAFGGAVVVVVGLILAGNLLRTDPATSGRLAPAEGFLLGSPTAPVLVEAWEDFQCPVCKAANASVLKQIEEEYVNSGKARLLYRQFPFLGTESRLAAEASQCAADQHLFWPYHDALFAAQRAENSGAFSHSNLKAIAANVGLATDAFDQCLESGTHSDSVQAEKDEGQRRGINGTPTFFVNGQRVANWRDYAGFKALIESALAAAAGGG